MSNLRDDSIASSIEEEEFGDKSVSKCNSDAEFYKVKKERDDFWKRCQMLQAEVNRLQRLTDGIQKEKSN